MNNKKYITQITADDLRKILRMANVKIGDGLEIAEDENGPVIQINQQRLKVMMWSFCVRAGVPIGCTLYETYSIPLDPP